MVQPLTGSPIDRSHPSRCHLEQPDWPIRCEELRWHRLYRQRKLTRWPFLNQRFAAASKARPISAPDKPTLTNRKATGAVSEKIRARRTGTGRDTVNRGAPAITIICVKTIQEHEIGVLAKRKSDSFTVRVSTNRCSR